MDSDFAASLPEQFVANTVSLCGETGETWLNALPNIIAKIEEKWSIKVGGHFPNLTYNYVANAALADGRAAVLKIGLPLSDVEIFGEAAYLDILNGNGTVRLLNFDPELQCMLVERAEPGANLKSVCKKNEREAVGIAIQMLKRVVRPVPETKVKFVRLDDWFEGLTRAADTDFPHTYSKRALTFYEELSADTAKTSLLHGDLHHENILSASREPFLLIDPKGIIGHIGYDIGVFLNNHHAWMDWDSRIDNRLDRAITDFSAAFFLEETAIRKWAFCQMVLSWWWMFDEMPTTFGAELGLSNIWKV